ncbi:MAG: hypothetical protein ACREXT_11710, partial [Gammaproteobacteria bacterium]
MSRSALAVLIYVLGLAAPVLADDNFSSLKDRVRGGDFSVDFRALRMAYAATPAYRPNTGVSLAFRQRVQVALEAKKFTTALQASDDWLAQEYVNPFAHLGAARAHDALGHAEQARFHQRVADRLYESICRDGEGFSVDSPCPVLSIDEEHFYLARHRFIMGTNYGATCRGDRPCNVYEVREPESDVL